METKPFRLLTSPRRVGQNQRNETEITPQLRIIPNHKGVDHHAKRASGFIEEDQ